MIEVELDLMIIIIQNSCGIDESVVDHDIEEIVQKVIQINMQYN